MQVRTLQYDRHACSVALPELESPQALVSISGAKLSPDTDYDLPDQTMTLTAIGERS
jgi:hypothetical protein